MPRDNHLHHTQSLKTHFDVDAAIHTFGRNIVISTTNPEDWRNGLHAQELHCLSAAIERGNKYMVATLINNFIKDMAALKEKLKEYEQKPPAAQT